MSDIEGMDRKKAGETADVLENVLSSFGIVKPAWHRGENDYPFREREKGLLRDLLDMLRDRERTCRVGSSNATAGAQPRTDEQGH